MVSKMTVGEVGVEIHCIREFLHIFPHEKEARAAAFAWQTQIKDLRISDYLRLNSMYLAQVDAKKGSINAYSSQVSGLLVHTDTRFPQCLYLLPEQLLSKFCCRKGR